MVLWQGLRRSVPFGMPKAGAVVTRLPNLKHHVVTSNLPDVRGFVAAASR